MIRQNKNQRENKGGEGTSDSEDLKPAVGVKKAASCRAERQDSERRRRTGNGMTSGQQRVIEVEGMEEPRRGRTDGQGTGRHERGGRTPHKLLGLIERVKQRVGEASWREGLELTALQAELRQFLRSETTAQVEREQQRPHWQGMVYAGRR